MDDKLMKMDSYFYQVKLRHPRILDDLRQVLVDAKCDSPEKSMTYLEIRAGYGKLTLEEFPVFGDYSANMFLLLSIPFVACFTNRMGEYKFYLAPEH